MIENTIFFHKMANYHNKRNEIKRIRIKGTWTSGAENVRQGIVDAFKNWLSIPRDWRASLEGLSVSRIDEREAARLEVPFTEEEVRNALNDLNGDKAPGSDGYTAAF